MIFADFNDILQKIFRAFGSSNFLKKFHRFKKTQIIFLKFKKNQKFKKTFKKFFKKFEIFLKLLSFNKN